MSEPTITDEYGTTLPTPPDIQATRGPRFIPAGTSEDVTDDRGRTFRICGPATVTDTAVYFPTIDHFLMLRDWDAVFIRNAQAAARFEAGPGARP